MKKEVFITYSWDSKAHNEKVLSFANMLRSEGFNANIDRLHTQNESATDFYRMMHEAITSYEKVIVVLSKGYKEKAENFKGGVGNEYNLIIKDIESQTNKYILVSFESISDEITPLNFKGRHIFDLTDKENLNELYAKLQNETTLDFAEVGSKKPVIKKTIIPNFEIHENNLEIGNLNFRIDNSQLFAQLYTRIVYDLNIEITNNSTETFSEYNIEIFYPINSTNYDTNGRIENGYKIITYDSNPKLFPLQKGTIKLERLIITNINVEEILNKFIVVKIYSDKGVTEKDFILSQILTVRSMNGPQVLTSELFQDKNFR